MSRVHRSFADLCTVAVSIEQSVRKLPALARTNWDHSDAYSSDSMYLRAVTRPACRSRTDTF